MATCSAVKHPPATVIDLTVSDDEDTVLTQARSTLHPNAIANQLLRDLPPSNHGLILPGTFNFGATSQGTGNVRAAQDGSSGTALFKHSISQGSRLNLQSRQTALRLQTTPAQTRNHRSTERSLSTVAGPATDRRISVRGLENAAKRRKTDGAMVLQIIPTSAHSVISAPNRNQLGARTQRPSSSTPATILPSLRDKAPAISKSQLSGSRTSSESLVQSPVSHTFPRSSRPGVEARPQQTPSATRSANICVARSRLWPITRGQNDKSRISSEGRIQKPLSTRSEVSGAIEDGERMEYVLRNQVIKHVKTAIARYKVSLGNADRANLWQKTVSRLTSARSFFRHYKATKWELPSEYEQKLAHEAVSYVDLYASEILRPRNANKDPLPTFEESSELKPSTEKDILMTSTRSSDSEEEIFENLPVRSKTPPPEGSSLVVRHYSSSPTTSVSLDANDGASVMDVDSHDDLKERVETKTTKLQRRLRSIYNSPKCEHLQAVDVDSPKHKSNQDHRRRPDMNAIRSIGSLRLTSADNNIARPYLSFQVREDIRRGCAMAQGYFGKVLADQDLLQGFVLHVDFCHEELEYICKVIQAVKKEVSPLSADLRNQMIELMGGQDSIIPYVRSVFERVLKMPGKEVARTLLRQRDPNALDAFLRDAVRGRIAFDPQIEQIKLTPRRGKKAQTPARPLISSLLRRREIHGMTPFRVRHGQQSLKVETASFLEDTLIPQSEWTDCCGDISTVCWTSDDTFICGATAHSDYHNMQYNKPGNLVVGSASLDTLRAVSNHRVRRPLIGSNDNAENALESMRQTQDPWLYTSVVSTSHSDLSGYTFSASFDHTVKVWKVSSDGNMSLSGAWYHDGKVNFVVTSKHHERVATASDVCSNAIRVYDFDSGDVTNTPYDTYCGEKAREQALEIKRRDTWAYFPATIQWGRAPGVVNFLLVGYSPRSITAHEIDIPEEKRNSGKLCLWNVELGTKIPISSARTQNVFEVIWHPTQPIFLAATSPCGNFEPETKTQIRLFAQNELGSFLHIKTLDCPAFDINELTIMPNSNIECYVTASCTDGNTYVWDTARGDDPIHTLGHGESLDNPIHDLPREIADTGVKFASWGRTSDRFYTGSSDGKVKAWDIRKPKGHAFVRTVLSVSGGVSAGAFSKNFSKLLIGDATGKVHLLEVDSSDPNDTADRLLGDAAPRRISTSALSARPKVVIPHRQPDPPSGFEQEEIEMTAHEMSLKLLEEGQVRIHPDPRIGAVQGPNYAETLLYRHEAHEGANGTLPLLPEWQAKQRFEEEIQGENLKLPLLPSVKSSDHSQHSRNVDLDFEFSQLSMDTRMELTRDRVDLDWDPTFEFELTPHAEIFKEPKAWQKRIRHIES